MVYVVGMFLVLVCLGAFWAHSGARRWTPSLVQIDGQGIRPGGGCNEAISWPDLVQIDIMTTDQGPFADDVFWLFTARDGKGCALPGSAVGDALFARLAKLPGVDFGAVVSAMGSVENASFRVWSGQPGDAWAAAEAG